MVYQKGCKTDTFTVIKAIIFFKIVIYLNVLKKYIFVLFWSTFFNLSKMNQISFILEQLSLSSIGKCLLSLFAIQLLSYKSFLLGPPAPIINAFFSANLLLFSIFDRIRVYHTVLDLTQKSSNFLKRLKTLRLFKIQQCRFH